MAANPSRNTYQMLGKHLKVRKLTYAQVAEALGCKRSRVSSLIQALTYPTADEIHALEQLIGLPIETMFDENMLKFYKRTSR